MTCAVGGIVLAAVLSSCSRIPTDLPTASPPALQISVPSAPTAGPPTETSLWADPAWKPDQPARDWTYLVIHHTATASGSVESIHRAHLARKDAAGNPWRGIGYHFVIGNGRGMPDGAVEPTFRWMDQLAGAHAGDETYNNQGIGICLVGNFEKHAPTPAQLEALVNLTQTLTWVYEIPAENVKRHGELKATACPGRLFSMQGLREQAAGGRRPDRAGIRRSAIPHAIGVMRSLSSGTRTP